MTLAATDRNDNPAALDPYGAATHEVINQPFELADYNLYDSDAALKEAVAREGAGWAADGLGAFGGAAGSAAYLELGALANQNPPELDTHDRYGRRVDLVRFHPAYHELMKAAIEEGMHASPWTEPREGAHVARAARFYMQSRGRGGARLPDHHDLRRDAVPEAPARPRARLAAEDPVAHLRSAQRSRPTEAGRDHRHGDDGKAGRLGRARQYNAGHSDRSRAARARLTSSSATSSSSRRRCATPSSCWRRRRAGFTCFLAPRWRPDGTKNPLQFVRLKRKMGNASNASSETEWRGALGWRVGPEGRGVPTIIEMVAMTRFDCMIGSSAGMRMAVSQAIDHCRQRKAFGA